MNIILYHIAILLLTVILTTKDTSFHQLCCIAYLWAHNLLVSHVPTLPH